MRKNKLKIYIFMVSLLAFFLVFTTKVNALDYVVSVEEINNLAYGNKLKDGEIVGTSEVEGSFSFANPDLVLDEIKEIKVAVNFTPYNDSYPVKSLEIDAVVNKRKVYVVFVSPIYKQYDGETGVELPLYSYEGIINNEVSVTGNLVANFSASYVGEGIPLILSGVELEGDKKDNYYLELLEHDGRIYPSTLEKIGDNSTIIGLDEDVYVDIGYSLDVEKKEYNYKIDRNYTAFVSYEYKVYSHTHNLLEVDGNYKLKMKIDESHISDRIRVFELTNDGEYRKIDYKYVDNEVYCTIASDSKLVFASRNTEYGLIALFCGILVFSLIFIIGYRYKNSRIEEYKEY